VLIRRLTPSPLTVRLGDGSGSRIERTTALDCLAKQNIIATVTIRSKKLSVEIAGRSPTLH
jgi:hypothetical protein